MFKLKLSFKLTLGLVIIVMISMLTISLIFIQIFQKYTYETREKTMFDRAQNISDILSENMQSNGQMRGFGGFMRFIDTMTEAKAWITDERGAPLTLTGKGSGPGDNEEYSYNTNEVPLEVKSIISEVLMNKKSTSQDYSDFYKEITLTVGVPILSSEKIVLGSVILTSSITGITNALNEIMYILMISILISLLIAFGLGVFFSLSFTRPLKKMNIAALEMAQGNYNIRTKIKSHDEIGQLGNSLDMLASELSEAVEEINKLEQVRRDFVANISHEFRTPLTIIKGSLEALSDGTIDKPEDITRYLSRMTSEARSLERLVEDLLELSRMQAGKTILKKDSISVSSLLSDVVRSMRTISTKKTIDINYIMPENIPDVFADYDRLRQLFIIFIDNAIKYSPEKTIIKIELTFDTIINIRITDQGYGIPKTELPYIWNRFYKANKSGETSGTGLGLSIAKHLVDLHDGFLSLDSELNKGTSVLIQLPISSSTHS